MKFASVLTFALTLGVSVASPLVEKRQTADALASKVVTIGTALKKLNATVSTLKVKDPIGFAKALQIQQQSTDVENAIKAAIDSANKSPQFDDDQSFTVAAPVLDLIQPIQETLNNIIVKKPAFATAIFGFGDLSKTVLASLQSQRKLTKSLGDAITAKLSPDYASLAPGIIETILGYFDQAIAAYQKCTGKVCLPALAAPTLPTLPKPKKSS